MTDKKTEEYCTVESLKVGDKFRAHLGDDWHTVAAINTSNLFSDEMTQLTVEGIVSPHLYHTKLVYVQRKPETLTVDKAKLEHFLVRLEMANSAQTFNLRGAVDDIRIDLGKLISGSHD